MKRQLFKTMLSLMSLLFLFAVPVMAENIPIISPDGEIPGSRSDPPCRCVVWLSDWLDCSNEYNR